MKKYYIYSILVIYFLVGNIFGYLYTLGGFGMQDGIILGAIVSLLSLIIVDSIDI